MPIDFLARLSPKARARYEATKEWHDRRCAEATTFTDAELADKLTYYMANSTQLPQWAPGEPVYDAAIWHVLLPEVIKRLKIPPRLGPSSRAVVTRHVVDVFRRRSNTNMREAEELAPLLVDAVLAGLQHLGSTTATDKGPT